VAPELHYDVLGAQPVAYAASPQMAFKLSVRQSGAVVPIRTVILRCQIRIEPARRQYDDQEKAGLRDLFDRPERWGRTMQPMLWTHAGTVLPAFGESVQVDLPVPCTFDFNVAATKYFHALDGGEVPLLLLFSGTVFHDGPEGQVQVSQIPWDKEVSYRLPVDVWRNMMEHYYPQCAWLCLQRETFNRLDEFKREYGIPTWEGAIDRLLSSSESAVPEGVQT
jgi:Family of unknown function (DUF6084)